MIGRLKIDEPEWDEKIRRLVGEERAATGQPFAAIHAFGLVGSGAIAPAIRLYAGYQHLKTAPEDGPQWIELIMTHLALGQSAAAERIVREMQRVGRFDLYPQVYQEDLEVCLAHVQLAAGAISAGLATLVNLAPRHAGLPLYHYITGSAHHALEHFEPAMAEYGRAIALLTEERATVEEEMDVDAILNIFIAQRIRAEAGEAFDGIRPLEMRTLLEEQVE